MKQYGAFDAKTHFSEILNSVAQGEKCVITRHGIKIALLIPFSSEESMNPAQEAIRTIKALRKGITLGKEISIKKLRAEGRR
ncbi:MAG: type II toxin-antitoxin system prevent-host-death family antitoxin [Parachlamydiaceae bacterium]|nr:type II toxin-antitoxin system prevent-host-death family antitoxin [Parachlamydiaceae bacterium]